MGAAPKIGGADLEPTQPEERDDGLRVLGEAIAVNTRCDQERLTGDRVRADAAAMRRSFAIEGLALATAVACGPSPGDEIEATSGTTSTGEATVPIGDGSSGADASTGAGGAAWTVEAPGCGSLYGVVVLDDGDLVAVGQRIEPIQVVPAPWAVRYTAAGEEVWSRVYTEATAVGVLAAVDRVGADEAIAVGYAEGTQGVPLTVRFAVSDGSMSWGRTDAPADSELYGAAWSEATQSLWVTGSGGMGMTVARLDGEGAVVVMVSAPADAGYAAAATGDGALLCGRAPTTEGGRLFVGRFAAAGELLWSAVGPDLGVGAFSDCWDVADAPDGAAATVERGYAGARVALYREGELVWEHAEPSAGAQAVDVADDQVVVAGWSASREGMPLRSHETGDRHGWVRRYGLDGAGPEHAWIEVDRLSPWDVKVHPDGWVAIVGERLLDECETPWIGRVDP